MEYIQLIKKVSSY